MLEQGEDGFLLGFTAPQGWTHVPALCSPSRSRGGRDVCENVAVRHDAIPSVATAHAPPPPKPHNGEIASGAGSAAHRACVNIDPNDALFAAEVQSFLRCLKTSKLESEIGRAGRTINAFEDLRRFFTASELEFYGWERIPILAIRADYLWENDLEAPDYYRDRNLPLPAEVAHAEKLRQQSQDNTRQP